MSGRTPNFMVVGLLIVIFLLGTYYMSCSSTTSELRRTLENFEERVRALALKSSEQDTEMQKMRDHVGELESKNSDMQKELEKKDSDIDDLNTKLHEKSLELQGLQSEKELLDAKLVDPADFKVALLTRELEIERLKKDLEDQRKSARSQLDALQNDTNSLKSQLTNSQTVQGIFNLSSDSLSSAFSNSTNSNANSLSTGSNGEPNLMLNGTVITNNTNQEFPVRSMGLNLAVDDFSINQTILSLDSSVRLERSLNGSLAINQPVDGIQTSNATTSTDINVSVTQTTATSTAENRTEKVFGQAELNLNAKDKGLADAIGAEDIGAMH